MDFSNLPVSYQYRSDEEDGNIVKDFYTPVLSLAKEYKRAVGYFTSGSLISVSRGMKQFIKNDGHMKLIASPKLSELDIEAIEKGYKSRDIVIEEALIRQIDNELTPIMKEKYNLLAWLISNNRLDIKIALVKGRSLSGIYHEKIGIVKDFVGHKIAFTGSLNETEGGLLNNFESIDVFCSWNPTEQARIEKKELDFDNLWNNLTNGLEVIEFPEAIKKRLLNFKNYYIDRDSSHNVINENKSLITNEYFPKIPIEYTIREYQQSAIKSWFQNDCQGLLEMATGTGKTITALSAIAKLGEVTKRLAVVIVCPYTHLVEQWTKDIKLFNMLPIVAFRSRELWEEDLANNISGFNSKILNHFCLVTTNATFTSETMQSILSSLRGDIVFIADEAHHFGAKKSRMYLNNTFPYRLALSATPDRWFDDEGSSELINYFGGKKVFEFGLEKAIGDFLTEYYYYPHIVELEEDEAEKYFDITRKIVKMYPRDGSQSDSKSLEGLLIERARIINHARNKIKKLKMVMQDHQDDNHNIVYCGDSYVDGEKQIDAVVKLLGSELKMKVHTFTSREDLDVRKRLLHGFEKGEIQTLVAIKCLDEGVDVPATQRAFILASSTNPREFIQRRGRILRKHPNKKFSFIHDFIVIPRKLEDIKYIEASIFNTERNLIKRELSRFSEFASLAMNGPIASQVLSKIKHAYNLLDK